LILESASPGIDDDGERRLRAVADNALADSIEAHGVAAFVDQWERLPMWASQKSLSHEARYRQRTIRLRNRAIGLANSLRGMGQGSQPSFWSALPSLHVPTLLIAGAEDYKFAAIAARMQALLPDAALAIVPQAGHAVHLEQTDRYFDLITTFLVQQRRRIAATGGAA
jgi:2-succinyl-6-hydroxy-2,4-cyclohexadiene-1-carboxylate synthase